MSIKFALIGITLMIIVFLASSIALAWFYRNPELVVLEARIKVQPTEIMRLRIELGAIKQSQLELNAKAKQYILALAME